MSSEGQNTSSSSIEIRSTTEGGWDGGSKPHHIPSARNSSAPVTRQKKGAAAPPTIVVPHPIETQPSPIVNDCHTWQGAGSWTSNTGVFVPPSSQRGAVGGYGGVDYYDIGGSTSSRDAFNVNADVPDDSTSSTEQPPPQRKRSLDSKLSLGGSFDNEDEEEGEQETKKPRNSTERLQRSRERNRIHARKTRQRKKFQLETLQQTMSMLQIKNAELTQSLNERIAAIKLLVLRAPEAGEALMLGVPDLCEEESSQSEDTGSESGSINSGSSNDSTNPMSSSSSSSSSAPSSATSAVSPRSDVIEELGGGSIKLNGMILGVAEMAQMDIDLELMRKDRSKCTQLELEQIRRERNRMHAKRTRVRKKVQMEELQEAINNLEQSNLNISERIAWLDSKSFRVTYEVDVPLESATTQ